MSDGIVQRKLAQDQVSEFYHDLFVDTQVRHFEALCLPVASPPRDRVVDIGGGYGFFAAAINKHLGLAVRVVDTDTGSVDQCRKTGTDAVLADALEPPILGDEAIVCFNLILHHLVAASDADTAQLQATALNAWRRQPVRLFVHEYIYDSYLGNVSGRLIYAITSSRFLSLIARRVASVVPSLRANTFGVGVRFRGETEWRNFFEAQGWQVAGYRRGEEEHVSLARRGLLIKSCRRDSFVLQEKLPQILRGNA